jgi:hypothetical protein
MPEKLLMRMITACYKYQQAERVKVCFMNAV